MRSSKSWLEVSEQRLRENYRALAHSASSSGADSSVLAVVKANAYGHGIELCAPVLASAGAQWLGVASAEEGVLARKALAAGSPHGPVQARILVLCGLVPDEAETIIRNQLTPAAWTTDQLDHLAQATPPGTPTPLHLEIDTGMSRQGVRPGAALGQLLDGLSARPELRLEGVMTHFSSAEIAGSPRTKLQQERFEAALAQIHGRGLQCQWIHAGSSSTLDEAHPLLWLQQLAHRYRARSLVRSGLAIYGYTLPLEGAPSTLHQRLKPVLTWKCRIVAIDHLPAGAQVGYNGTFAVPSPMRVALLPVGYSDGLRRELSSTNERPGGWVTLHCQLAPIIGRISMNLTTVDITNIPGASVGDEVSIIGEGVTAEDHARLAHTIPYEILCGLRSPLHLIA